MSNEIKELKREIREERKTVIMVEQRLRSDLEYCVRFVTDFEILTDKLSECVKQVNGYGHETTLKELLELFEVVKCN